MDMWNVDVGNRLFFYIIGRDVKIVTCSLLPSILPYVLAAQLFDVACSCRACFCLP
jgi:hypothetical protein